MVRFEIHISSKWDPAYGKRLAMKERYLQFENLDMNGGEAIRAACTDCGRQFLGKPNPSDRIDDVLMRMRADFEAHICHEDSSRGADSQ